MIIISSINEKNKRTPERETPREITKKIMSELKYIKTRTKIVLRK